MRQVFWVRGVAGLLLGLSGACATAPAPASDVAPVTAEPAAPVFQLDDIVGAEPDAVDALLGAPALVRREGAGEYRRYRLKQCALIVILYPDEIGVSRAAHVETSALTSEQNKPALKDCLAAG